MDVQGTFSEKLIENLKHKAERSVCDDPGADGWSEQSYDWGQSDGETYLAREILDELGIEYGAPADD